MGAWGQKGAWQQECDNMTVAMGAWGQKGQWKQKFYLESFSSIIVF